MPTHAFTIAKLADAAGIGVEAVRYYQRRGLLAEPSRADGGFRRYTADHVRHLLFIKRAQDLGFSLDDVAELSSLSASRSDKPRVRELTRRRALEIRERIATLEAMAAALESLATCCARTAGSEDCPIVAAVLGDGGGADGARPPGHAWTSPRARTVRGPRP